MPYYHADMTELRLDGFNVGGDPRRFFPSMPAGKVAVGFLTGDTTPAIVSHAMHDIITGNAPAGCPGMIGAMFWSNTVGPQLHSYR
ncbi:MAG: hypothetical protein ABI165_07050 [Bryobacteraceae bacterium]